MKIDAVKVQRLYLQVANQLSDKITNGKLPEGTRLPSERDLASSFGVSRPTIREAMIALEVAGLVDVRSGSGVFAKAPAGDNQPSPLQNDNPGPIEVLEARLHIESEAAAMAAQRIKPDELRQLRESLTALAKENTDGEGREEADRSFHLLIAQASRNSAVHSIINWLWQLRNEVSVGHAFHEKRRRAGIKAVINDHRAIVDAIAGGDPGRARAAMRQHLDRVMDTLMADPE